MNWSSQRAGHLYGLGDGQNQGRSPELSSPFLEQKRRSMHP
ncbi:hypothetical protein [Thermoleptolyngbya sp. M55_K2018_002]|nr:hypothetical protein [Thermoleptolyngbya sp. M55_K2018_002]